MFVDPDWGWTCLRWFGSRDAKHQTDEIARTRKYSTGLWPAGWPMACVLPDGVNPHPPLRRTWLTGLEYFGKDARPMPLVVLQERVANWIPPKRQRSSTRRSRASRVTS